MYKEQNKERRNSNKTMQELNIKYMNIRDLKPYKKNAKKHSKEQVEQIANSIKEFGFTQPVIIDKNNEVVAGHGRILGAKKAGLKQVPTVCLEELTEEQIKAYRLVDNKLNESEWNNDLLNTELSELWDAGEVDMTLFDFNMDNLFEEETENKKKVVVDDEYIVKMPEKTKTKRGYMYKLGRHYLMCGDSTNEEDVIELLHGNATDICITSPPYNAGLTPSEIQSGKKTKYDNKSDSKTKEEYKLFLQQSTKNAIRYSKYAFINIQQLAGNKVALIEWLYSFRKHLADTIIWDKINGQPAMGKNILNSVFEFVFCFSKENAKRTIGTIEFRGTLDNIIHLKSQHKNEYAKEHNATYPIDFCSWFIQNFADKTVLDLFGGTGTTLIACEQLGKQCYMMELDERYCDIIVDRFEKYTGKKAKLVRY